MAKSPLKVGFIGSGWARIAQAPAFAILDGVELTAVSSPTRRRREKFRELFDIPHAFENWQDLMKSDLDLVCIASPPDLHREMTLAAIASGKSVLCEKPMAVTVEEAREMASAVRDFSGLALIGHELRFHPAVRRMKLMIESGEIGKLYEIRAVVTLASRNRPDLRYSWWCEESRGGGALSAIGSHLIDLARFLVGEVSEVSCDLLRYIPTRPDHDGTQRKVTSDDGFSLRMKFGASSLAFGGPCCCNVTTLSGYTSLAFEAIGSLKTISFDGAGKLWEVCNVDAKGGRSLIDPPEWRPVEPVLPWDELVLQEKIRQSVLAVHGIFAIGFAFFAHRIARALRSGQRELPDAASFEDGLAIQKVLHACRKSSVEKRWVTVA